MDQLANNRQIIQKILTEYQQWAAGAQQPGVQQCVSFDEERDHYFWFHVGWDGKHRDLGVTAYLSIPASVLSLSLRSPNSIPLQMSQPIANRRHNNHP